MFLFLIRNECFVSVKDTSSRSGMNVLYLWKEMIRNEFSISGRHMGSKVRYVCSLSGKGYVFQVRSVCSLFGKNMCSRSGMCVLYLEGIRVPGRENVFCI